MRLSRRQVTAAVGFVLVGVIIGGYAFARTQPRSILAVVPCTHCLAPNELAGLIGSVVVERAPIVLQPVVVYETDKSIAITNIAVRTGFDYVVIPKKDITDAGNLSTSDQAYLIDAYAVMDKLVADKHLRNYQILTYGPGYQKVRYLHFHLESPQ